jgi:hypothetical protein
MSSCRCCLIPHPLRLIERLNSSIHTIKFIRRNCSIFENILLDKYEHLERISSNLNKYLMHYGTISNQIFTYLSQFRIQLNNRLENYTNFLYEIEYLTIKCSIWLKNLSNNNSIKQIRSQLKHYGKQLNLFHNFVEQHPNITEYKNDLSHLTKKFWKDFSIFHVTFQTNYQQQCLQMDSIEREHMKIFFQSIQLFSSIISPGNNWNIFSTINIDQDINEWREKNKFRITWVLDEHQEKENLIKNINKELISYESSSDIEIKAIEDCLSDNQSDTKEKYAHESNLSWSFTIGKMEEDMSVSLDKIETIFLERRNYERVKLISEVKIYGVIYRQAVSAIPAGVKM